MKGHPDRLEEGECISVGGVIEISGLKLKKKTKNSHVFIPMYVNNYVLNTVLFSPIGFGLGNFKNYTFSSREMRLLTTYGS